MNFSTRVRYNLARLLLGTSQKAAQINYTPMAWARTNWLDPSFERLTREGYLKNAAVFICINKLAKAYQQGRIVVKDRNDKLLPTHPLQKLLDRPAPDMSWRELAQIVTTYKAIGGVAYLYKNRGGRRTGPPIELTPFHAGQVRSVSGDYEPVAYYEYDPTGRGDWIRVDKKDIIALKWHSIDPFTRQSVPPLHAIAHEVDMDSEATRYAYALLANDAAMGTIIELDADAGLNATEIDAMKAQFNANYGGGGRGSVGVLQGGKVSRMSLNMQELAFDALRRVPEARISAAFGIPPEYSGLTVGMEHSTYNNVSEARAGFFEDTIMELWVSDADELTHDLAQEFGDNLVIEYDTSKVIALQENQDAVYTRVVSVWEVGLVGQKEARRMLGLPEELQQDDTFKTEPVPAPEPLTMPNLLVEQRGRGVASVKALEDYELTPAERRYMRGIEKVLRDVYQTEAQAIQGA